MWWWAWSLGGLACDGGACPNASAARHRPPPSREVSVQRAKLAWATRDVRTSGRRTRETEKARRRAARRADGDVQEGRAGVGRLLPRVPPAPRRAARVHRRQQLRRRLGEERRHSPPLRRRGAAHAQHAACVDIKGLSDLMSYELRGGSSAAARLLQAHLQPGTLVVGLDDDEYVVFLNASKDLSDLAVQLRQKSVCAMQLLWKVYGSSHHECQPDGPFMREFTRRGKQMAELNQNGTSAMLKEMNDLGLNDPFVGKPVFFYWGSGATSCGTHSCKHCPKGQSNCAQRKGPSAECEAMGVGRSEVWINHYFFQSKEHWTMKKLRGRTNHAPPRRGDTAPESYEAVVDRAGAATLDRRVQSVRDPALRGCLAQLFRTPLTNRTASAHRAHVKHAPSKHTKHAGSSEAHLPSSRSKAQRKAPHYAALDGSQRPQKSKTPGGRR